MAMSVTSVLAHFKNYAWLLVGKNILNRGWRHWKVKPQFCIFHDKIRSFDIKDEWNFLKDLLIGMFWDRNVSRQFQVKFLIHDIFFILIFYILILKTKFYTLNIFEINQLLQLMIYEYFCWYDIHVIISFYFEFWNTVILTWLF